jgi:hypothetical protein
MTTEHHASRTLVKSPPELWAECSEAGSLARHIGEFGEIRITRLEPETSVSWEAEHANGTVEIEPSGWGTRVTLTAQAKADGVGEDEVAAAPEVEDPATAGVQEEPVAMSEGAAESAPDPSATQFDPVEEEADAKVEETVAESDPAVAADPVLAVGRWKRLIARSRAWFRSGSGSRLTTEEPSQGETEVDAAELPASVPEALEVPASAPNPALEPPPALEPDPQPAVDAEAILAAALDSLGQAHHRPFSRA